MKKILICAQREWIADVLWNVGHFCVAFYSSDSVQSDVQCHYHLCYHSSTVGNTAMAENINIQGGPANVAYPSGSNSLVHIMQKKVWIGL